MACSGCRMLGKEEMVARKAECGENRKIDTNTNTEFQVR